MLKIEENFFKSDNKIGTRKIRKNKKLMKTFKYNEREFLLRI